MFDETNKCKHFEHGLKAEIRIPVTTSTGWSDFVKIVEVAMRVERSLAEEEKYRSAREGPCCQNISKMRGGE